MSATAVALIGYAAWTALLALTVVNYRALYILNGSRKANEFAPNGEDLGDFSQRLCRAYYNCCENLPAAAAILLYAIASGQTAITDGLALLVLGARIGQTVTHLIAVTHITVLVRATFYVLQLLTLLYFCFRFVTA